MKIKKSQLVELIKNYYLELMGETKQDDSPQEFEEKAYPMQFRELQQHPELKDAVVSLLTENYRNFISGIEWVAPKPLTFRIRLKNAQEFYLYRRTMTWVAKIEGRKYFLSNEGELDAACDTLARVLSYGIIQYDEDTGDEEFDRDTGGSGGGGGGGNFDFGGGGDLGDIEGDEAELEPGAEGEGGIEDIEEV